MEESKPMEEVEWQTLVIVESVEEADAILRELHKYGIEVNVPDGGVRATHEGIRGICIKVKPAMLTIARDALSLGMVPTNDARLCCPQCGSFSFMLKKLNPFTFILYLMMAFLPSHWNKRRYVCDDCSHVWDVERNY